MKSIEKIYLPRYRWYTIYRSDNFKKYPWYVRSPLLHYLVGWLIIFDYYFPSFGNNGKFNAGDVLVYNWKAYIEIYSAMHEKQPRIVSHLLYKDKGNVEFTDGSSCSCFWVRKATSMELKNLSK